MRKRIIGLTCAVLLALCTAVLVGAGSASARPALDRTVTGQMTLAKVVRELGPGNSAGMIRVLLSNGATIDYPMKYENLARRSMSTPDGSVSGNCGTSYINLYERSSGHPVHMTTGFHVIHAAISYGWAADILGPDYDYEYTSSGDLFFDSTWAGQHTSHKDYPRGIYDAWVFTSSYALLDTGSVCTSGGPTADRLL